MLVSFTDADLRGKTVLLRVDFNVPLSDGIVKDDTRIVGALPTIRYLLEQNCKVILCSHLGRPKGKIIPNLSLEPVAEYIKNVFHLAIEFFDTWKAEPLLNSIHNSESQLILLENTRFHPGEETNDLSFSKLLSELADVFVSDAFGAVHRAHASTQGITRFIPGYAGFLVSKEVANITKARDNPTSPSVALFGGAKISTKLDVLENFIDKVDNIVLGGGMANTFLKAQGFNIGTSLYEEDMLMTARDIINKCKDHGINLILPKDVRLAKSFDEPWIEDGVAKVCLISDIPINAMILDIGPETVKEISTILLASNAIIWNGPMGVFEKEEYRRGTIDIAELIVNHHVETIIGGGETAYAMNLLNREFPASIHISTGGGASLELMSGKVLPGLSCLNGELSPQ